MSRATNNPASRARRNKVLSQTRGFHGGRSKLNRTAQESLRRALAYAYRDRRTRKRDFRRLWITRINAAARLHDLSYSAFISGLKAAEIEIGRAGTRGPLHGVPIALKDLCATRGVRTTAGTRILRDWIPEEDACVVERPYTLEQCPMHEFCLGVLTECTSEE